jgi:hypothetical protein
MTTAPTPTPTPRPTFVVLESPDEAAAEVKLTPELPVEAGKRELPRRGVGVLVGVKSTPILFASDIAYATGNTDKSFASQATYRGSAIAVPSVIVIMFELVDLSFIMSS